MASSNLRLLMRITPSLIRRLSCRACAGPPAPTRRAAATTRSAVRAALLLDLHLAIEHLGRQGDAVVGDRPLLRRGPLRGGGPLRLLGPLLGPARVMDGVASGIGPAGGADERGQGRGGPRGRGLRRLERGGGVLADGAHV